MKWSWVDWFGYYVTTDDPPFVNLVSICLLLLVVDVCSFLSDWFIDSFIHSLIVDFKEIALWPVFYPERTRTRS
jgi:hypothetical protein